MQRRPTRPLEPAEAKERALRLLARREHGQRELKQKLTARGASPELAEATVEQLTERGFQSDERYAERLVTHRAQQGYGPNWIRAELGQAGVSRDEAARVLDELDIDWTERARDLLARKGLADAADAATRLKAGRTLAQRGFTGEHARAAQRAPDED